MRDAGVVQPSRRVLYAPAVLHPLNHKQTIAYFKQAGVGRTLDDALALRGPDMYSAGSPVLATTTKLRELQLYRQPLQKPHPQIWEPLTSPRSVRFAAQKGVNGYFIVEPNSRLRQMIAVYYEEAEKAGWPDRLGRGPFKYGWDSEKRRGVIIGRYVHIADKGIGDLDRAVRALTAPSASPRCSPKKERKPT